MTDFQEDSLLNILIVGHTGTGKTSIVTRFVSDTFSKDTAPTMGVDFRHITIELDGKTIKLQMWDTSGFEKFKSVITAYVKNSDAIIVVFDVFDPTSLSVAKEWFTEIDLLKKDATKMLLANKYEQPQLQGADGESESEEKSQPIPNAELISNAKLFAKKINVPYFEVSAKTGEGIEEAMMTLVSQTQNKLTASTGSGSAPSNANAEDEFAAAKSSTAAPNGKGKAAADASPIPQQAQAAARWLQGMVKTNATKVLGVANEIKKELVATGIDMKNVITGEDDARRLAMRVMCCEHGQIATHYCLECDRLICPQELLDHGKGQEQTSETFEDADEDGFEVISAEKDLAGSSKSCYPHLKKIVTIQEFEQQLDSSIAEKKSDLDKLRAELESTNAILLEHYRTFFGKRMKNEETVRKVKTLLLAIDRILATKDKKLVPALKNAADIEPMSRVMRVVELMKIKAAAEQAVEKTVVEVHDLGMENTHLKNEILLLKAENEALKAKLIEKGEKIEGPEAAVAAEN